MNTKTTLYLGRNIAGRPGVSLQDFTRFLEKHVSPIFPGFTVLEGIGYFSGEEQEDVFLLLIVHDDDFRAVDWVAKAYKAAFSQGSVFVVSSSVSGRFL